MIKGVKSWRHLPTERSLATLLKQLGRRWALRVIWELRAGALTFRALQAACGNISPSVLQARLHEFAALGVIEKIPRLGYRLSASGEELYRDLEALGSWSEHHSERLLNSDS